MTPQADKNNLIMGSYGLGLSRIIASSVETLSLKDELRWPRSIVPFSGVIIPPKVRVFNIFKLFLYHFF